MFWRKTKTRLTVDSFFSLFCDDDGETQKKTTLMVFEREKKRDGDPLRARVEICCCFFESSSTT